ncbi:hypothetical protein C8R48DRAFT_668136 [Suillus tomentosus]|nr:hypothetical protein C8R48DRAFT_668136 [Suillus tomentosus]
MAVGLEGENESDVVDTLTIISRTIAQLKLGVPLPMDEIYDPLYEPTGKDRFSISLHGGPNTYLLSNKHNYDDYIIYLEQMADPAFDVMSWLINNKLHNYDDLVLTKSSLRPTWGGVAQTSHQNTSSLELALDVTTEVDELPGLLEVETSEDEDMDALSENEGRPVQQVP